MTLFYHRAGYESILCARMHHGKQGFGYPKSQDAPTFSGKEIEQLLARYKQDCSDYAL
jgi:hypothetical protein